jgi:predicted RNA-binding protein with PIN domain
MLRPSPQAVLLVDGYNVIGSWSSLTKVRDRHGLESARQELVEALINYSAFQGYQTHVIFDAHAQNTPTSCEVFTSQVSVFYTEFGQTADTYIEKFCASFRCNLYRSGQRLIVATSDRAQQLTVIGYGAEWMSSQQLVSDVEITARRSRRKHRPQKQARGRFLFNCLDAKAQERLAQWRQGMK